MEVCWQKHPTTGFTQVTIEPKPADVDTLRRLFPQCDVHNPPWEDIVQELIEYGGYEERDMQGDRFTAPRLLRLLDDERRRRASSQTQTKPAGTVNQRMAEMLLGDQQCIGWSRHKWSQKLNCSESAVQQAETWEKIMLMRDAEKLRRRAD